MAMSQRDSQRDSEKFSVMLFFIIVGIGNEAIPSCLGYSDGR